MPLGNFTCVLRTQFKEVLDVEWCDTFISFGMNDVNYDALDRSKFPMQADEYIYKQFD